MLIIGIICLIMHRLHCLIRLYNVYTEHRALDLLHSSDMHTRISGGISAGTDTRPLAVISAILVSVSA